jgi:ABC-type antimicrobial peptide transport system ATPase subunit
MLSAREQQELCNLTVELCCGTKKETTKCDGLHETPRHSQRLIRFYTNLADKTNHNQTLETKKRSMGRQHQ